LIEFCVILPVLVVMLFAIIDFGLFIRARLIITNVTREGGNLASRDIKSGNDLIALLQSSASPLDLKNELGRIYISTIDAALTQGSLPVVSSKIQAGNLNKASGIPPKGSSAAPLGLTSAIYDHLVYRTATKTADINGVTVVETFYKYKPITPLPRFIANILLKDGDGTIIGSRAVFCTTGG
jgi:hypothetical protein